MVPISDAKAKDSAGLKSMRLFIAIELGDELRNRLDRLRADIPGARWVPAAQIHLTLAFLGEVDEIIAARLTEELSRIRAAEFVLSFSGSGCFPNLHRPRVLWLGLKPEPRLDVLASKVHEAVLACGIPQEERPFSPHITLARLKLPPSLELYAFLDQQKMPNLPSFEVGEFILFQSRLNQQGAQHTAIRNFHLQ